MPGRPTAQMRLSTGDSAAVVLIDLLMTTMPSRLPRLLVLSVLLSVLALGAHAAIDTHNATAAHVGGGDLAIFVSDDRAYALAI